MIDKKTSDVRVHVERLLTHAGLSSISAEDREDLVAQYPRLQTLTQQLRSEEMRYAHPAIIFPASTED